MKRHFYLLIALSGLFITSSAQQINAIKIGSQTWTMSNLNIVVPGSWNYNDDPKMGSKYGRLYTYEAAKNVCPSGWRLPTVNDWSELLGKLGGEDLAAPMMLKSSGEGGFNAKLSGLATIGNYQLIENYGAFWTATENDKDNAWYLYFTSKSSLVTTSFSVKSHGLSVRCIKGAK